MDFKEILSVPKTVIPWVILRFVIGFMLLWAFFDKMFGLGMKTSPNGAVINGGSPTAFFLDSLSGPMAWLFKPLAGNPIVDFLLMASLLCVGIALIIGIGVIISAIAGGLTFFMMWLTVMPISTNPIFDEHIVYIIVLAGIALSFAGNYVGLGKWWAEQGIVKRFPILR